MCGIVGYIGSKEAAEILLDGLRRLEYRGYDSSGLAILDASSTLHVSKAVGRLSELEAKLEAGPLHGTRGIGHTRWATHGEPSERNAHPHMDESGSLAVVHNGIIENYQELKAELQQQDCTFQSDTDTEVLPHLIAREQAQGASTLLEAVRKALSKARGAYALGVISKDDPDTIYAARLGSPLVIGVGEGEYFIASDVPAVVSRIQKVIYLKDGEVAALTPDGVKVYTLAGDEVPVTLSDVTIRAEDAEKAGFETFMLKEIHEQPRILRNLLRKHTLDGRVNLAIDGLSNDYFRKLNRVMIISCGTAYHAGMYGKLLMEHVCNIAVEVDLASEFRYRDPKVDPGTLIIPVSQSGETADTLASIRMARAWGCKVLSICNVQDSSLVRDSDAVLYTEAGPEIGVASTKAYTAQLMAFVLLTLAMGRARNEITPEVETELLEDLAQIPDAIHYVIDRKDDINQIAEKHHDGPSSLYLGRKFNYPTALEGALKNKEISYQHAEGYAAGEMKHGPIALINEYLPVICICTRTRDEVYEKMISNMKEVEARHGRLIAVATDGDTAVKAFAEDIMYVPAIRDEFSPMVNVVALQLLAYYAAQARGTDIDKPRNLAKSVTVE
ncbi:MAG: glutamine--fructose-6-phosphate transaminase (isomerizing) [Verrucomicrobia bacterium]|nr:glutamine--fructose-6-phosphate transaminase (isomerizing) [Verrucomicrobiota bacterium]